MPKQPLRHRRRHGQEDQARRGTWHWTRGMQGVQQGSPSGLEFARGPLAALTGWPVGTYLDDISLLVV